MSTQKHTPTPWAAAGEMVYATIGEHVFAKRVADCSPNESEDDPLQAFEEMEPEANAAFIFLAVNSHDALVAALTSLLGVSMIRNGYFYLDDEVDAFNAALIQAKTALALAQDR